jgi:NitT/TauT family transport system substrate-binding protein
MSRIVGVAVAALLVLAGCAGTPERTESLTELRVALTPTGSGLPIYLADTRGIFARHGLHVTRTEGQDVPAQAAALAAGRYDVAGSVPTTVLVGAEHGLDLQVICRLQRSSAAEPNSVWVTRDRSITSLGQLKGRRIAVPALTGVIVDALLYDLRQQGVRRSEVTLSPMPLATMGDQLRAGRVDAAVATIPFYTALSARGFAVHDDVVVAAVTRASRGAVTTGMTALVISTTRFTREHADRVRAFRAALTEAVEYLRTHEAEARQLLVSWLKMTPEVARAAPLPSWDVQVTPADLRPYVTIGRAVGSIKGEPDVETLVWHP